MSRISDVLSGRFLVGERSIGNWTVVVLFVVFAMFLIYRAHRTESMVMEVAVLKKELKSLRAEYIESSEDLMKMRLESSVRERVSEFGLHPSDEPPFKIKVE